MTIFSRAMNPFTYISIDSREIHLSNFNKTKYIIYLNNDFLVTDYILKDDLDNKLKINISYDYVQDHFNEIEEPLETYKNMIIK